MEFSKISRTFRKKNGHFNYDLAYILNFYDAYLRDRNIKQVSAIFGMTHKALAEAIERHPELQEAMAIADENRKKGLLAHYIVSNLSPQARAVWDRITKLDSAEEIEQVFKKYTVKLRQQLFCTAVLYTGHDNSKALRLVGISYNMLMKWRADPEFLQMLEEVQWHKKQFFQKQLIGLVSEGHPGAVLFVNRTVNADMGYSERLELNMQAQTRSDYDLNDLGEFLDLETQKKILAAIEAKKARDEQDPDIYDVDEPPKLLPAKVAKKAAR